MAKRDAFRKDGLSLEEVLSAGPIMYDLPRIRRAVYPGKRTKMGFIEFIYEMFRTIERNPDKFAATNTTLEERVAQEFCNYPHIVRSMTKGSKGGRSLARLRYLFNSGRLKDLKNIDPPLRISFRYGIPRKGPEAIRIREWCRLNPNQHPKLIRVNKMTGETELTREEARGDCLFHNVKDERFFTAKERSDSEWKKLQADYLAKAGERRAKIRERAKNWASTKKAKRRARGRTGTGMQTY